MREKICVELMLVKFRVNNCCQTVAQLPSVGVSNCIWGEINKERDRRLSHILQKNRIPNLKKGEVSVYTHISI